MTKPSSEFHRSRSRSDGLEPRCKACRSAAAKRNPQDKVLLRTTTLTRLYGITPADLADLMAAQGGVCAICKQPERMTRLGTLRNLCVDHCHKTGKVRGLLCAKCNMAIGHLTDDPTVIHAAAEYLRGIEKE